MAPGWRNRFNKRDRFQKLDDNDVGVDDDFGRKEITPFASLSPSSDVEKTFLIQTPAAAKSKPLNDVSTSPETPSTTNTTPRASPVSLEMCSNSSQNSNESGHKRGKNKSRSSMELDGFLISNKQTLSQASVPFPDIMNALKETPSDDDLVEIYEAEDSSASYQVANNTSASTSNNPFEDDDDVEDKREDNLVEMVTSSSPVDLDELDDELENDTASEDSLPPPSVHSHGTDASEDIYMEGNSEEEQRDHTHEKAMLATPPRTPSNTKNAEHTMSPVKTLVASFNKKSYPGSDEKPPKSTLSRPSVVQRSKSIPLVRPPPTRPRPVPVPIPTNVPLDSDSVKDLSSNSKDNASSRSKSSKASNRRGQHLDMDDDSTPIEIHGIDLLEERDNSVSELQEMSHLMTFNALILIQKQKDWLEGSSTKGKSTSLMFELENMERKIKLLSDHREWPNETERRKQQRDPLTPSKAFFKAMSLLDRSIEQFHQGYLSFTAKTSQENHELKRSMEQLQSKNSALLQDTQTAQHSLQVLENERNELIKQLQQMEKHLSLVQIKIEEDMDDAASTVTDVCANNGTFLSKVFSIKAYIETLEEKQREHLEEIELLKSKVVADEDSEDEKNNENVEKPVLEDKDIARASSADSGCLDDDLGSRWHTLEASEAATEKAAEKERQVADLCAKLADREKDLASLRSECKLIRMQLLQEERSRNEFNAQMAEKDSALSVANERISNLEEEVLKTHARCATFEEDYAALKDSFATQKEATLKELGTTHEDTKTQMERMQSDFETKLTTMESRLSAEKSEKDRLVRDLKASLNEIEEERDQLKLKVESSSGRSAPFDGEEKKEPEKEDEKIADTERLQRLEEELKQFERMRERLAEKACAQASTIATLTEANENKEAQLTSLQEMIEMLLLEKEANDNTAGNQMRQRIANFRDKMREGADLMKEQVKDMSRHG